MHDSKHKSLLATVFGILVAVGAVFLYVSFFGAPERGAETERFIVPLNSGSSAIIEMFHSGGFIKSETGLRLVLQFKGKDPSDIEPGGYRLSKSMSAWEVASVLAGDPYMKWVVIPEGLRKEQIAELLAGTLGWTGEQKSSFVNTYTSIKFDEVEGVYFPDTYLIPVDEGLGAVADRLRAKFNEAFAPYLEEANKQNIKWTTLLKIASLVQREAAGASDMPLIAGILWNRLLQDMKLDIDATIQYARGNVGEGWWAPITVEDKQIDSPYNTYLYKGLPPHPIANPGINAIEAVLFPQETDCLYYLHDADGNIHCSADYEGHQENIEQYLR